MVGTQKNNLHETVLLSTKTHAKIMSKKIITIYADFFCLS